MAPLIATTLLACLLAYFLSYILYSTPTAQNHTLAIHLIFTGYYWSMSNLRYTCLGWVDLLYPVSLQTTPYDQKHQAYYLSSTVTGLPTGTELGNY